MFYVTINNFLELYNVLEYYIMNDEEHYDNDNGDIGKYIMNEEYYNKYMQNKNNIIIKIEKEIILRELTNPITNRLTEYTMSIIKRLIKNNPDFIIYIEQIIIKISKHNKIDSNYIPEIILIISRLYNIILIINSKYQRYTEVTNEICGYIFKFIITLSINNTKNNSVLICFDNIIDACIKLLQSKSQQKISLFEENNGAEMDMNSDYENNNDVPIVIKEYGSCCF